MEVVTRSDAESRFVELAREVGEPLRRFLLRRTDADTAEDVLADTMLVLWRRLEDVPAEARLPWAYGVARGCLANAERAHGRHRRLQARLTARLRPEPVPGPEESLPDPAVHAALARLTPAEQELLRLWAWEQLEPREIAVVLGVTPNAVSIRLHRARRHLAEALGSEGPDGAEGALGGEGARGRRKTRGPAGQDRVTERRNR